VGVQPRGFGFEGEYSSPDGDRDAEGEVLVETPLGAANCAGLQGSFASLRMTGQETCQS